jgi:release factor glutamine methyltransferase
MELAVPRVLSDVLRSGTTVGVARRHLAEFFRHARLDSPELDARILTGHVLGLTHAGLAAAAERRLDDDELGTLTAFAARRLNREPVARIVECKEFWGLSLRVSPETLVPRPETETVVEAVLETIERCGWQSKAIRIADLGTGSGALLIALMTELPNAIGVGTDVSGEVLTTARDNSRRAGVEARTLFTMSDFGAALEGSFDFVVSNPPYVKSGDIAGLAPEVRFDPRRALDGGGDGLDCYRAIVGQLPHLLKPAGWLVTEIGYGQEAAVARLCQEAGLIPHPAQCDLAGIPRALKAILPP